MESLFLVSLPHLWQASVSWFTPPCLFLLLNGIIMILTATSGRLSSPSPPSQSPTNFLAKIQKFTSSDDVHSTELPSAAKSPIDHNLVDATPMGIDPLIPPALQLEGPIVSFSNIPLCYHCLHAQDTATAELELHKDANYHDDFHDANANDNVDDENLVDMQIVSQEEPQRTAAIVDRPESNGNDDLASSSWEEVPKAGSEPSTPTYSSAAMIKDNMRRSLSIDSAPYINNIEDSPEYKLSEEAFKKRIEDYIFKVNAKLRSETRLT